MFELQKGSTLFLGGINMVNYQRMLYGVLTRTSRSVAGYDTKATINSVFICLFTFLWIDEAFPYHVATEVMYQSLISFLKVGSSTIRHVRYIDSNPDHVNLIVTSIKPKIENVTYDER